MRPWHLPLIFLCLLCVSCSSVYVGRDFNYPPGAKPAVVPRGDGYVSLNYDAIPYQVSVGTAGAPGKGYSELSRKRPRVEFYKHGVKKGKPFEYAFTAENLVYEAVWHAPGDCTVVFYNLPRGVYEGDKGAKARRKELARRRFRYDKNLDEFREIS